MDGTLAAGRAQLQAGNVFAAIRSAKQVLQEDPQDVEAMDLLCSAHMAEQDYMSAQQVIDSWLRIMPDDSNAHASQIMLQMTLGRQDDAKARIDQFSQSFPNAVYQTAWLRAIWEEAFGSPARAADQYEAMLAAEPDNTALKIRLAMTHVEGRNILAARALMLDVLSEDANSADALRTLAISELKSFQLGAARELADAARAANPKDMAMKKVKWLSWLVLFPPFAAGHLLQMLVSRVRFAAGDIAAHVCCGLIAAAMIGALIWASETNQAGGTIARQSSLLLASGFLAGAWALVMYYLFGIGNADEDKKTATLTGGY